MCSLWCWDLPPQFRCVPLCHSELCHIYFNIFPNLYSCSSTVYFLMALYLLTYALWSYMCMSSSLYCMSLCACSSTVSMCVWLCCVQVCKERQLVKQQCNSTHDQLCECAPGFHLVVEFCITHSSCPPGYGVTALGKFKIVFKEDIKYVMLWVSCLLGHINKIQIGDFWL